MTERQEKREKLKKLIRLAPLAIVGLLVFTWIGGSVVMLLWNWLAPTLFELHPVTFWQALGLLALCRILFGGFRLGDGGRRYKSRKCMRGRMREHWEQMTPEERESFRQGIHGGGLTAPLDKNQSA